MKEVICGVDFGYTNPAAILKIGVDNDNNFWVLDEWYKTKQSTEEIINVVNIFGPNKVFADPAEPDRLDLMMNAGVNVMEVSKDIVAGIDVVREHFKQNRIRINKGCKHFIWELETYKYPEKKPDKNAPEVPVKEADHLMDSLRYAIYCYEPPVNMENIDQNFNMYTTSYD